MTTNKITIYGTIIIIILILGIPTTYKVIQNHNTKLIEATESKIIEAGKKCYFDGTCEEDKITLKTLYDLNYLDKISNPITKEYYNENSYILIKDKTFTFIKEE